jgi:hypothetical protein
VNARSLFDSNPARDALRLLYRYGVNDGMRTVLDKRLRGEDYCVEIVATQLASAIEARSDATGTGAAVGESAVANGETPTPNPEDHPQGGNHG